MMDINTAEERGLRPGPIVAGVILLGLGAAMFLGTTGVAHIPFGRMIGPLVLITLGASILLEGSICGDPESVTVDGLRHRRRRRAGATGGIWLIGVGCWMAISQTHLFGLDFHTSWPLLIILSGVIIVIRGLK